MLRQIAREFDMNPAMAARLKALKGYEIVLVCDDSGSMKTPVDNTQRTRWDELCDIAKAVLRIGVIFDSRGVDIYFLNRDAVLRVTEPKVVDKVFSQPPCGYTPLVPILKYVFDLAATHRGHDKKLLVFIATDGVPTDLDGNENVPELERLMREKRQADRTHVSFLVCTDDQRCVRYLNDWDRTMVNVDVTDDFNTERAKIRQFRGDDYPFSQGDYVVKALVGAIDPEIDAINEP